MNLRRGICAFVAVGTCVALSMPAPAFANPFLEITIPVPSGLTPANRPPVEKGPAWAACISRMCPVLDAAIRVIGVAPGIGRTVMHDSPVRRHSVRLEVAIDPIRG